jgi:hypothetical protein
VDAPIHQLLDISCWDTLGLQDSSCHTVSPQLSHSAMHANRH